MKKQHLLWVALCLATAQAWGQETIASGTCGAEGDGSNLAWTLTDDGTLTISGEGEMGDFFIAPWSQYTWDIKAVVLEKGVMSIAKDAFYGCSNLTSITIPEGVISIGNGAFYGCSKLTSVNIPSSIKNIGERVFQEANIIRLTVQAITPPTVTSYSFEGVNKYIQVYVPEESVENYRAAICWGEFDDILAIGATWSKGGNCSNWASSPSPLTWMLTADGTFTVSGKGAMNSYSDNTPASDYNSVPWYHYRNQIKTVVIEEGITNIGSNAFCRCALLTSVSIPNSVTSIGSGAFSGCSLASINIPSNVTSIGSRAFSGCSFTSVDIPSGVTNIEDSTFLFCYNLATINFPNGLINIGNSAFSNCLYLTTIEIPESVTSIGDYAFFSSGLTSVLIPESVTNIGDYAFNACDLTSVTIPESVEYIGEGAFGALTGRYLVVLNYNAVDCLIGNYSGDVLTNNHYAGWSGIITLNIGAQVKNIPEGAFEECTQLHEITSYSEIPPTIAESTFKGVKKFIPVYVPNESIYAYRTSDYWMEFTNILPFEAKHSNGLAILSLSESITVVGGEVHLNLPGTFEAQVYDLQGRHVLSTTETSFALPQGTYIIKVGDEAVKVAI